MTRKRMKLKKAKRLGRMKTARVNTVAGVLPHAAPHAGGVRYPGELNAELAGEAARIPEGLVGGGLPPVGTP
jgi:hypothetical protein